MTKKMKTKIKRGKSGPKVRSAVESRPMGLPRKQVKMQGAAELVIHHRELAAVVSAASSTPHEVFTFQPGELPWLSAVASRYEFYELIKCDVEYVSFAATTTSGTNALMIDFDVRDAAPPDVRSMISSGYSTSANNWSSFKLHVAGANVNPKKKYVRVGEGKPLTDARLYDAFKCYGSFSSSPSGHIWVDYVVKFSTAQIASVSSGSVACNAPTDFVNHAANDYSIASTAALDSLGPIPLKFALPTAAQISAGATTGVYGFEMMPGWEGLVTLAAKLAGADAAATIDFDRTSGVVMTEEVSQHNNAADDEMSRTWRVGVLDSLAFIQPYLTTAVTTPSLWKILMGKGEYSNFG